MLGDQSRAQKLLFLLSSLLYSMKHNSLCETVGFILLPVELCLKIKNIKLHSTYLLTPWCIVLLEKLTGLQLVKKFPAFHGTRRFITALTSVRHLSLSWASPIQSIYPQPTSWRSILILSTHLRLGLPSGLFTSGFPSKALYTPSPHPYTPYGKVLSNKKCVVCFFWIIPRRLNFICRRFGTLFLFHLHGQVHTYLPMKMEQTECPETSAYKIQRQGNYPEESIQHSEHGESLKLRIKYVFTSFSTFS